jgi:sec-independent protein translocase protein TatC
MVQEPEEGRDDYYDEEEEGGPVKTFLEHLEDLRWTLIKSVSSVFVAMVVCLMAGKHMVAVLAWPLEQAKRLRSTQQARAPVYLGTNVLGRVSGDQFGLSLWGTNHPTSFKLVPMQMGTNYFLGLQTEFRPPEERSASLSISLKNYSPLSAIIVAMKLALYGGLVLSAPFVFYFVGQFVLPALKVHEKKILFQAVSIGSGLFLLGVAFCYFLLSAIALSASVQFSEWLGFGADEWRAEDYIGFVCKFMLGMGLSFELPVVLLVLVKIGLLDYEKLSRFRMYWVVINLVICAFATPSGDPITMFLMALPLQVLYEISVLIARIWERKAKEQEA